MVLPNISPGRLIGLSILVLLCGVLVATEWFLIAMCFAVPAGILGFGIYKACKKYCTFEETDYHGKIRMGSAMHVFAAFFLGLTLAAPDYFKSGTFQPMIGILLSSNLILNNMRKLQIEDFKQGRPTQVVENYGIFVGALVGIGFMQVVCLLEIHYLIVSFPYVMPLITVTQSVLVLLTMHIIDQLKSKMDSNTCDKLFNHCINLSIILQLVSFYLLVREHPGWDTIESLWSLWNWLINQNIAGVREFQGAALIVFSVAAQLSCINDAFHQIESEQKSAALAVRLAAANAQLAALQQRINQAQQQLQQQQGAQQAAAA